MTTNPDPHAKSSQPPPGATGYKRQSSAQRGDYLSFSDGQTRDVQIMAASAIPKRVHWVDGKSVACTGPQCANCLAGGKVSERWSLDVIADGKPLVWEMANLTFAALEDAAEMVGYLYRLWVRVKRTGTGINTRYTMMPLAQPPPEEKAKDMEAQAKYINDALTALGIEPKHFLAEFLLAAPSHIANGSPQQQMDAFLEYVDSLEEPIPSEAEAVEASTPASAADYF